MKAAPPPPHVVGSAFALRWLVVFVTLMVAHAGQARANCPNGEADDSSYCVKNLEGVIVCDLGGDESAGVVAYAVYDSANICAGDYCVWGTDGSGDPFCSEDLIDGATGLVLRGGTQDDYLYFSYNSANLNGWDTAEVFVGLVQGNEGNDTILGANIDSGGYTEVLNGNDGNDTIEGASGADTINGGDDNDTITGGDQVDTIDGAAGADAIDGGTGDDVIYGGSGNDIIYGAMGNDTIDCGSGSDRVSGGNDNDTIIGATGVDFLCGDAGQYDEIYGGPDNDVLWDDDGSTSDTYINGQTGAGDACQYGSVTYDLCESELTERPLQCPT